MDRLRQADTDAEKAFGASGDFGDTVVPCFAATVVTVSITPVQPVSCPGHDNEIRAVGTPAGGTYTWSISGGGASLVDGAGLPTAVGTPVFLRSFKPDHTKARVPKKKATLKVTYTHPSGTAKATKKVTIHHINFVIRKIKKKHVKRGWTQKRETAGGVRYGNSPGLATMAVDPQVEIRLADSCPRKAACAGNHRVGWLQTVLTNTRRARYRHSLQEVTVPLPIRDAAPPYPARPFYMAPSSFTADRDKKTAHHEDSPGGGAPWSDPRVAPPPPPIPAGERQLRRVRYTNTFRAWLVVQNVEWSVHDMNNSFVYLRNFWWRARLNLAVDVTRAIGKRCSPLRRRPTIGAVRKGRGPTTPVMTAPIANTSANVAINPAAGIP